jgi:hypothetical protein
MTISSYPVVEAIYTHPWPLECEWVEARLEGICENLVRVSNKIFPIFPAGRTGHLQQPGGARPAPPRPLWAFRPLGSSCPLAAWSLGICAVSRSL